MTSINHLRNRDAQKKVQTVATGLHTVTGHVSESFVTGIAPNHQITLLQALGDGGTHGWNKPRGVYYKGFPIKPEDYHFHAGRLANSMTDGDMSVDEWFPLGIPHSGTATIAVRAPVGVGDANIKENPPDGFAGIFETMKLPDFDASGNVTGWSYTANPARCLVGLILLFGSLPVAGVPDFYKFELAQSFLSKINWSVWCAWRDYCAALELVDYTTIPGDKGCGVSVSFYNGINFNAFISRRIEPTIDISSTTGSPGVGVNISEFSARFEGFIKAPATGSYKFKIIHDNGARIYLNGVLYADVWGTYGMTGDIGDPVTLNENQFYNLTVEWFDGADVNGPESNPAYVQLLWSTPDAPANTFEIVPVEVLFPKPEMRPRYESHVFFDTPTSLDSVIESILLISNSVRQDVDGKIEFYTFEQIMERGATFDFIENVNIKEDKKTGESVIKLRTNDQRARQLVNALEGKIRDLDSQNLEEPISPVIVELLDYQMAAGRRIEGAPSDYFNMTRWQLRKLLLRLAARIRSESRSVELTGTAETYPVIANDLVRVTSETYGWVNKLFEVAEASDLTDSLEERLFVLNPVI